MAQILDDAPAPAGSRRAKRLRRRTRRTRTVAAFGLAALVAASLAAVGWSRGSSPTPPTAAPTATSTTVDAAATPITAAQEPPRRALTAADPMRLWIAGDSLAGALGPSLGDITGDTGVVQPQFDSRVSSGLASNGVINWPKHAAQEIARLDPEVIVFFIGTNDYPIGNSTPMQAAYRDQVANMMSILTEGDRPVYWIGAPVMRPANIEKGVLTVNEITQTIAPQFPSLTYVDAHAVFDNDNGSYTTNVPDITGKSVRVRADDGIHLTNAGGDHLAGIVYSLIDAQWKLTEQAIPGAAKKVYETQGSRRDPANQNRTVATAPAGTVSKTTTTSGSGSVTITTSGTAPATSGAPGTSSVTTASPTTASPTTASPTTTAAITTTAGAPTATGSS